MLVQGGDLDYFKRHLKEYFSADYDMKKVVAIDFYDPGDGDKWPEVAMTLTKDTPGDWKTRFRRDHFQVEVYGKDENLLFKSEK